MKSKFDADIVFEYEIRADMVTFELPFVNPILVSKRGEAHCSMNPTDCHVMHQCGPLIYTVTISTLKKGSYEEGIKVKLEEKTVVNKSATVSVKTDDQSYALLDGGESKEYHINYAFDITAKLELFPTEVNFQVPKPV